LETNGFDTLGTRTFSTQQQRQMKHDKVTSLNFEKILQGRGVCSKEGDRKKGTMSRVEGVARLEDCGVDGLKDFDNMKNGIFGMIAFWFVVWIIGCCLWFVTGRSTEDHSADPLQRKPSEEASAQISTCKDSNWKISGAVTNSDIPQPVTDVNGASKLESFGDEKDEAMEYIAPVHLKPHDVNQVTPRQSHAIAPNSATTAARPELIAPQKVAEGNANGSTRLNGNSSRPTTSARRTSYPVIYSKHPSFNLHMTTRVI
jgi:hypothetical protein